MTPFVMLIAYLPALSMLTFLGMMIATLMAADAKGYSTWWTLVAFLLCAPAAMFFALAAPARAKTPALPVQFAPPLPTPSLDRASASKPFRPFD